MFKSATLAMAINPRIQSVIDRLPRWEVPRGAPPENRPLTEPAVKHLEEVAARLTELEAQIDKVAALEAKKLPPRLQRIAGVDQRRESARELWLDLHAALAAVELSMGMNEVEPILGSRLPQGINPFDRDT